MKFLLLGIVIAILATVAASARPSLEPVRMDWSTVTGPPGNYYKVATKKDLLVYFDITPALSNLKRGSLPPPGSAPVMGIRRRNAEGVYVPVANITSSFSATASTNGKWVAIWSGSMTLVSVDSNNNVSEPSTLGTSGGYLLSDDTFVAYDPVSPLGDGNYTIRSYQYDSSNNTWLEIPGTELTTTLDVNIFGSDYSAYLATDTHLLLADVTNSSDIHIQIYSRQADKSWKFVESVPINSTFGLPNVNLNYNGVDTLVVSLYTVQWDASGAGVVFVYTKTNGQWNEQTFTTASVGYRPQGNLGQAITFLDANSLFLSAGGDGYSTISIPNGIGKVLLLTRNSNGVWEPSLDLIDAKSDGQWGTSVGFNDYDIIVPTLVWRNNAPPILAFSALPLCFQQPINVTCKDQQVSDCSQLDVSSLFTVNNAQCGAVSATLNGLSLVNNKALQAQFSFTKVPGLVASCNATVTCPVPAPVVTQTPTSKVVSGTSALELGVIAVFLSSAMMVL